MCSQVVCHGQGGTHDTTFLPEQVLVLSEGHQLFFGPPQEAIAWFSNSLGYTFSPSQHGAESDWLMDLVSVGFCKPPALRGAFMASREDVAKASQLWHAHCLKARHPPMMPHCGDYLYARALASCTHLIAAGTFVSMRVHDRRYRDGFRLDQQRRTALVRRHTET